MESTSSRHSSSHSFTPSKSSHSSFEKPPKNSPPRKGSTISDIRSLMRQSASFNVDWLSEVPDEEDIGNYTLVISVDFGTSNTGYGFSWFSDKGTVLTHPNWRGSTGNPVKTLSKMLVSKSTKQFLVHLDVFFT